MANDTKISSTKELLEFIFKNSKEAIVLIDIEQNKIIEINNSAMILLNIKGKENVINRPIDTLQINGNKIFKSIVNGEDKGLLNFKDSDKIQFEKKYINNQFFVVYFTKGADFKPLETSNDYRDLFDNTFELLYILDDNYNFIDVNKTVIEKYGYSKEEIIGKNPELFAAPGLNDMKVVGAKLELAKNGKNQNLLWWSIKKNGDVFLKDMNFRSTIYQGKTVLIASARDISEKYNYEKNLAEKEKRYRQLFERNLAGVYQTSYEGKLLECNDSFAKILGYKSQKEIKNEANADDFYFNKNERLELLKELNAKQYVKGKKINLVRKGGEKLTVLINVSFIYDKEQKVKYLEGSLHDITELERAQNLLKKSEENYKELLNGLPFGVLIIYENKILYNNNKAQYLLQFKKNELLNSSIEKLLLEKDKDTFLSKIEKLKSQGDVASMEMQLKENNSNKLDVETKLNLVDFDSKKCVFISFLDIGDRKKAEKAKAKTKLLEAELKYNEIAQKRLIDAQSYTEGIIESSLDMIFTCDTDNKINKLNIAALNELGINNSNALNKNISIIFFNKSQAKAVLQELNMEKKYTGEVQLERADGSIFPAFLSLSYLYNSDNEILGIMGVSRDITELIRREKEYKRQALKLNSIIESSSHFFLTINRNNIVTSYNHVFKNEIQNNFVKEVEIGRDFFDLYSDNFTLNKEVDIKFLKSKIDEAFKGKFVRFELKTINSDKKIHYREVYLNPIYNDNGKISEISGIGHDITDKKISEKKLKASLNEKEVLLKEVHHRVKNNMQVISSILNLQSNYSKDKQILEVLHESQNRIKSMALIHERLYQNKDISSINFTAYIKELTENLLYSYGINKPSIELNYVLDEVYLKLDTAIPCGLILNELISNSLKYAFPNGRKGKINVELKEVNQTIKLKIKDNGIGLPEKIDFKSTKTLGLQLVNTLVNQLEGHITLNRKIGTTFIITFEKTNIK